MSKGIKLLVGITLLAESMIVVTQSTDSLIDFLHDSAVCCFKLSVVINSILISKNVNVFKIKYRRLGGLSHCKNTDLSVMKRKC